MSPRTQSLLKLGTAVVVAVAAVGFVTARFGSFRRTGEEGALVWFYRESSRQLYAAPSATIPPERDGVRAVVVCYPGEEKDPSKRQIAYLETYGPELKALLERLQSARSSGHPSQEKVPARSSEFFRTNDLVKRPGEAQWYSVASAEGRKLSAEWRSWRGTQGQTPIVCVP